MKILFNLIVLLLIQQIAIAQPPPNSISNSTNCSVDITIECYDICVLVSSNTITLGASQTTAISSLGGCANSKHNIVYKLCWSNGPECTHMPIVPCTRVDGVPTASSPCSPNTFTSTIQAACDFCAIAPNVNGIAKVDYDMAFNYLWIH